MNIKVNFVFVILTMKIFFISAQEVSISEKLKVIKLAEHTYLHTGNDNNGVVFISKGEAIIVSTPDTDEETQNLINWVLNQKVQIVGYVIDRWHPDAMGGINAVHKSGIKTYTNIITQNICKEKGLPVPLISFNNKLELNVGDEKVICDYLGPAHTEDGIVVWIPSDKILFGGNEVRATNFGFGNIGDANLKEWSNTITKVKEKYGSARIVVPGHGNYGGVELLDHTIKIYKPNKWGDILKKNDIQVLPVFNDFGAIFEIAQSDSVVGNNRYLNDAVVFVNHSQKYLKVKSPKIVHSLDNKMITSELGRLQLYNKETNELIEDLYYKKLSINLRDDAVEWTIIIKEAIR